MTVFVVKYVFYKRSGRIVSQVGTYNTNPAYGHEPENYHQVVLSTVDSG